MCLAFRKSACLFGQVKTKMHLPDSRFFKKSLAGASGLVLMSVPILQLCGNDTKIMFSSGCSAWIWSQLWSLILDLVLAPCCEPGPLWSHRNSFSLYIVFFSSLGIFIAMRYNFPSSFRFCKSGPQCLIIDRLFSENLGQHQPTKNRN